MHDIRKKIDALKIKDYKRIIEVIDSKVDRFTNIKRACEQANISYRLYYTARSFLAKYDKPVEIQKVFKNKQNYNVDRSELEKKKKEDIMELMYEMGRKDNDNDVIDTPKETNKNTKRIEKDSILEKKNIKIINKSDKKSIEAETTDIKEKKNTKSIYDILSSKHKNFS